jgi:hypothetical protein
MGSKNRCLHCDLLVLNLWIWKDPSVALLHRNDVEEKTVEQFTITTTPHVMLSVSEPSLHD